MMLLRSRLRSQLVHTIRDSQGTTPAFHHQQYTKVEKVWTGKQNKITGIKQII